MKKIDCIFYLVDNYLYLYSFKNNKLSHYKLNNSIFEGRIIKQNNIIKKLNELLKEDKIAKIFTVLKAYVIYEPHIKYIDKKIIIDTFEQCGFKDIKLVCTNELIDRNNMYLEINNNYMILYNGRKYELLKKNSFIEFNTLIKLILKKVATSIYLIGINIDIENIVLSDNKLFYLENSNTYFIDRIIEKLTIISKNC